MKKLLLFAIIIGGSIAFTSCSKDEKCVDSAGNELDPVGFPGLSASEECALAGGTLE